MSVEADIVDKLLNDGDITDLIGQRLYPVKLLQDTPLPAINFFRVSSDRQHSHDGAYRVSPNVQFSCWGESFGAARDLADTLIEKLDGFSGFIRNTGQVTIFLANDRDMPEAQTGIYHIITEFEVHHVQ